MSLPKIECPTAEVDFDGQVVKVRGLLRKEIHDLGQYRDDDAKAEAGFLAYGCGVSIEDAVEWLESAPAGAAKKLLDKVMELSGLGDRGKASNAG